MDGANGANRAERFEDEKRRIIESVFNKKDKDGSLLESYITHIRIIEDAGYPSSPPPPDSSRDAKKPRVIIVAVRKSGRVLMHKARENANGTFSIGKTWPLDDLSAVESFTGARPTTMEDRERQQWAGGVGFIVTIGKPYYWQANTEKEKQFFVASLVKIYTKYTGGKSPELIGFDDRERNQLVNAPNSQRPQAPRAPAQAPPPAQVPSMSYGQGQTRGARQPGLRPQASRENMGRPAQPPVDSRLTPQSSRSQMQTRDWESPTNGTDNQRRLQANTRRPTGMNGMNESQESLGRGDEYSLPPRSRGGAPSVTSNRSIDAAGTAIPAAPMTANLTQQRVHPHEPIPIDTSIKELPGDEPPARMLPERKRPMPVQTVPDSTSDRGRTSEDTSLMPAPLRSPSMRREEAVNSQRLESQPHTPISNRPSIDQKVFDASPQKSPQKSPKKSLERALPPIDTAKAPMSPPDSQGSPLQPIVSPPVTSPTTPVEDERPGLGPMIKKKQSKAEIASSFRKMAFAAGAFKPRAGGAAERLRELGMKSSEGPDGITGVVPAPSLLRSASSESTRSNTTIGTTNTAVTPSGLSRETKPEEVVAEPVPDVKVTRPLSEVQSQSVAREVVDKSALSSSNNEESGAATEEPTISEKPEPREARRKKPASERTQKELASLGLEPSFLEGRGTEFVALLDEFGWVGEGVYTRNIDEMKADIEREIDKAQAGGWLDRLDEEDEKVAAISAGIDSVIAECEELDGLLTLYSVELGTLTDDVAYIEAQSQGLQVQAANQKLLQAEVQSLLNTISISPDQLQCLKEASPGSHKGLEQIEGALVLLFKAMVTIDPSLSMTNGRAGDGASTRSGHGGFGDSEIGKMRVLQEKKQIYNTESIAFLRRLKDHLNIQFAYAFAGTKDAMSQDGALKRGIKGRIDPRNHELAWRTLWKYGPLMLFAREVSKGEWESLMRSYEVVSKGVIQEEFGNAISAWKRNKRKPAGDDTDFIFVNEIEKKAEQGLGGGLGRKLTVKAPQLNRLRSMGDMGGRDKSEKGKDSTTKACDIFTIALEEMSAVIFMEQNFLVDFFHITSIDALDFPDSVYTMPPDSRHGVDLRKPKLLEPNRDMVRKIAQFMEEVYTFWPQEMQNLIAWTIELDPTQGVGVLVALERKLSDLEETGQEFLSRTVQKLHARLLTQFKSFLGDQIRNIEDTKVKIKKRKGVIGFIRVFPQFSDNLESMLVSADDLDIRETVNAAYIRIIKTMFDSLKVIARDNPIASSQGASLADPEAKEALNYQILLIENMNHYIAEVDTRDNPVLEDYKQKAAAELREHLGRYIGAVIRRPLGKLLDILESTESRILSLPSGTPPSVIASNPSHSKTKFKTILAIYDSKEIRTGIEALKGRVIKHFSHHDDKDITGRGNALVNMVLEACLAYYAEVERRVRDVSTDVYEGDASIEWISSDVTSAFRGR